MMKKTIAILGFALAACLVLTACLPGASPPASSSKAAPAASSAPVSASVEESGPAPSAPASTAAASSAPAETAAAGFGLTAEEFVDGLNEVFESNGYQFTADAPEWDGASPTAGVRVSDNLRFELTLVPETGELTQVVFVGLPGSEMDAMINNTLVGLSAIMALDPSVSKGDANLMAVNLLQKTDDGVETVEGALRFVAQHSDTDARLTITPAT